MPANSGGRKLGDTALSGYWRQGLAEIRAASPYADSSIAQQTNYAMPGVATPGEVTEARRDESLSAEDSVLESRLQKGGISRDEREQGDRGIEQE